MKISSRSGKHTGCNMCGKGDTYRPVDWEKWEDNYEAIFGKKFDLKLKRKNKKWVIEIDNDGQEVEIELNE